MALSKPRLGSRSKKTVYLEVGICKGEGGHIKIFASAKGFPTTVSPKPGLRYHPNLYKKLKGVLEEFHLW
jgi:hypothetical protein